MSDPNAFGSQSFEFPELDSFLPITEGPPGARTFFVQAVAGIRVVSIKVEKQQVEVLANHIEHLLESYEVATDPLHVTPESQPALPEWTAGSLALAISEEPSRVVVIIEELYDTEANPDVGPENTAQFALSATQAGAFVQQARSLVSAGRPLCPLCAMPMSPDGHDCPRLN